MPARRLLAAGLLAGVLSWLTLAASAQAAVDNLPALAGVVRDACTGQLVFGATESLIPLSGQIPPDPIRSGAFFAYQSLPAGGYDLAVQAPGYHAVGGGGGLTGVSDLPPGAPFSYPTPPPILPAGAAAIAHLGALVNLAPTNACTPTPPPILPALTGAVIDATSGQLVSAASVTLVPTSNQNPSPPPIVPAGGLFAFPTLQSADYTLQVTAPGYQSITNIPYTQVPPNPIFPGGSTTSFISALDIQLAH